MLRRAGVVAILCGALAGCDEGPATTTTYVHPAGTWDYMVAATSHGPMLADISGRPFDLDKATFEDSILAVANDAIHRRSFVRFTAKPETAPQPSLRVVLTFNAGEGLGSEAQCRGGAGGGGGPRGDERVEVVATFCQEEQVLANVKGWVARAAGPDDRRFQTLIGQVVRELFIEAPP